MNLRNWNKEHTLGLLLGILGPIVAIPMVVGILSLAQSYGYSAMWDMFQGNRAVMSKVISLSIIVNLGLFYLFLNKEKYNYAMGIILGSFIYLPVILYLNFIA